MTTDKLIERIKMDRKAGSGRNWTLTHRDPSTGFLSEDQRFLNAGAWFAFAKMPKFTVASDDGEKDHHAEADANARRIARVPDMEALILADAEVIEAAKELAAIFQSCIEEMMSGYHDQFDEVWTQGDFEGIERPYREALAAFNTALEGKDAPAARDARIRGKALREAADIAGRMSIIFAEQVYDDPNSERIFGKVGGAIEVEEAIRAALERKDTTDDQ